MAFLFFYQGIFAVRKTTKTENVVHCVQVANGDEKVANWKAWLAEQIKRDEEAQ
jgi:uncharacterized protein with PhoU and TrkA domain